MPTSKDPKYVVLEFDESVTTKILDEIEEAVSTPHAIPELLRLDVAYDDGFGRLVQTDPK